MTCGGDGRAVGHRQSATRFARFPGIPASIAGARRFVGEVVGQATNAPLILLLVSELATNAVVHGDGPFEIRVATGGRIRIEVHDGSRSSPRRQRAGALATTGRGLQIVDALAASWGVELLDAGKVVWFEV